jgi:hypothetical protein
MHETKEVMGIETITIPLEEIRLFFRVFLCMDPFQSIFYHAFLVSPNEQSSLWSMELKG